MLVGEFTPGLLDTAYRYVVPCQMIEPHGLALVSFRDQRPKQHNCLGVFPCCHPIDVVAPIKAILVMCVLLSIIAYHTTIFYYIRRHPSPAISHRGGRANLLLVALMKDPGQCYVLSHAVQRRLLYDDGLKSYCHYR